MKVKTSITLSEDVARQIDRVTRKGESRSRTIERLLREGLEKRRRAEADRRELAAINEHAEELNAEAEDVLAYQIKL
jgi:metal-responsive CopG/Arc/MetJ family transcriptional regulator